MTQTNDGGATDLTTDALKRLAEALRLIADIETPQAQVLLIARAALASSSAASRCATSVR